MDGFVVLPDSADVPGAFTGATSAISHPSGRPWIIGSWAEHEIVQATIGSTRVAVIGFCPITAARLSELFRRVRTLSDVDTVVRDLPGSFHLVVAVGDQIRVQGSISGLCRVFHAAGLAASRSDLLARHLGAPVNDEYLAVRLLSLMLPPPLADMTPWSGVEAVPAGSYVELAPARAPRVVRWWRAPRPDTSMADGVAAIRDALVASASRVPARGRVSADMSGGMDSTSLCFMTSPDLVTVRWAEADVTNDDAVYSALAAEKLPHAEHVVLSQDDMPGYFAGVGVPVAGEEPFPFVRVVGRLGFVAEQMAARGSTLHLAGHGGDEIFTMLSTYLHGLFRDNPLVAWRHLSAHRSLRRWRLLPTLKALANNDDLATWWQTTAAGLTEPPLNYKDADFGWMWPLHAPASMTPDAVATARQVIGKADVEPLAEGRAQHSALATVQASAPVYRVLGQRFAEAGVDLHLPYFDDRLIEAVLSVRLHERTSPLRYKPLLAEAMRGIVPDPILSRSTKGEFSSDVRSGMRRHLPEILELLDDSLLESRGLIDAKALRTRLLAPHPDNRDLIALDPILACENWLRSMK